MPAPDVHTRLLQPLNTTRIAYMVTGGLAAIIYGEPRLTNDVVAPIEYVILRKLEYYRMASSDRHLGDIAAMRRISGAMIDRAALAVWIGRLGLEPEWRMSEKRSRI